MSFDQHVPTRLLRTQIWFGSVIGRPLEEGSQLNLISPTGAPMEEEASEYLLPSPTLLPHQRIQIYNQQYWWRLLKTLHESFPLVVRLFGYTDFNVTLAVPYLERHRPRHWSLSVLGDRFFEWASENYTKADRELVLNAIALDHSFNTSFFGLHAPSYTANATTQKELEQLLDKPLILQSHITLHHFSSHLIRFREELKKEEPEYWIDHPFPKLEKGEFYFVLYRNRKQFVCWEGVSEGEWNFLKQFERPKTLSEMCEEWDHDSSIEGELEGWLQRWTALEWLKEGMNGECDD